MADREVVFHVTIPAGTQQAAPQVTALVWDPGYVRSFHVTIPDGHAGLTGYAISYAGRQLIPDNVGAFIVSNDEKIEHDLAVAFIGQQWSLSGYNTDVYDHTFHLRVLIEETPAPKPADILPANITADTVETISTDVNAPADITDTPPDDTELLAAFAGEQ